MKKTSTILLICFSLLASSVLGQTISQPITNEFANGSDLALSVWDSICDTEPLAAETPSTVREFAQQMGMEFYQQKSSEYFEAARKAQDKTLVSAKRRDKLSRPNPQCEVRIWQSPGVDLLAAIINGLGQSHRGYYTTNWLTPPTIVSAFGNFKAFTKILENNQIRRVVSVNTPRQGSRDPRPDSIVITAYNFEKPNPSDRFYLQANLITSNCVNAIREGNSVTASSFELAYQETKTRRDGTIEMRAKAGFEASTLYFDATNKSCHMYLSNSSSTASDFSAELKRHLVFNDSLNVIWFSPAHTIAFSVRRPENSLDTAETLGQVIVSISARSHSFLSFGIPSNSDLSR
jgi:hypothetical protein